MLLVVLVILAVIFFIIFGIVKAIIAIVKAANRRKASKPKKVNPKAQKPATAQLLDAPPEKKEDNGSEN